MKKESPSSQDLNFGVAVTQNLAIFMNFDLYAGNKNGHIEHGLGEGVVLLLTEKLTDSNCEFFIDNFFNSPQLQLNLLHRGIFSAGTVCTNRKGLPKQEKVPTDKEMKKERWCA